MKLLNAPVLLSLNILKKLLALCSSKFLIGTTGTFSTEAILSSNFIGSNIPYCYGNLQISLVGYLLGSLFFCSIIAAHAIKEANHCKAKAHPNETGDALAKR